MTRATTIAVCATVQVGKMLAGSVAAVCEAANWAWMWVEARKGE
jgi:hypothetical protein